MQYRGNLSLLYVRNEWYHCWGCCWNRSFQAAQQRYYLIIWCNGPLEKSRLVQSILKSSLNKGGVYQQPTTIDVTSCPQFEIKSSLWFSKNCQDICRHSLHFTIKQRQPKTWAALGDASRRILASLARENRDGRVRLESRKRNGHRD